jgi:hypothetical protein
LIYKIHRRLQVFLLADAGRDYPFLLSGLGAGFGAGLDFFAGLEMPKLMRRKPNPLRSESSTLNRFLPSKQIASVAILRSEAEEHISGAKAL